MNKRKGFTLVEIMIVVAIIILLAAIAVPNLLRARVNANQSTAAAALHTVSTAAQSYRAANTAYPLNLTSMAPGNSTPPYIDAVLGAGAKQGYNFALTGAANTFTATARPQTYQTTGERSYFVDESGVIRFTTANAAATSSDAALD